ncbi:unnamed protein product [Tetraodon nigroviridis]|uniref:Vitamin K-dependent protein S n=1 Tax=Tetraodon nigroviridis TaxID=99883 RepID=Q4SHY3_TETNG|nr:unnamed protein product [Tetraodon nigroviridis]
MRRPKRALGDALARLLFLVTLVGADRFLSPSTASQFLRRHRRANSLFEESKPGNLERECIEELCNKEEAREIFENQPETEYFYPKYVVCLGSHRVGIRNQQSDIPTDLRTCVTGETLWCNSPPFFPICFLHQPSFFFFYFNRQRSVTSARRTRATKRAPCAAWTAWLRSSVCANPAGRGNAARTTSTSVPILNFQPDATKNVSTFPVVSSVSVKAATSRMTESPAWISTSASYTPASVKNRPGVSTCRACTSAGVPEASTTTSPPGPAAVRFSPAFRPPGLKTKPGRPPSSPPAVVSDVDECQMSVCDGLCRNTVGSYQCHCDGRLGLRLAEDGRHCQRIPVCVDLFDYKHPEMLYLGEQFSSLPVMFLRYRLPENTKFAAEFDFRTFDPEGVVLYAESSQDSWFMLGLRDGRIEVQFNNQHTFKLTSGGKAINDGQWRVVRTGDALPAAGLGWEVKGNASDDSQISVDELESSISVKISKEAVMSINSPESLFVPVNGVVETKVYIAGLPERADIIKQINPRLDGCIRAWNLMNQGASRVKEVIQERKSKQCFVSVEKGSFFSGRGLASFDIDYSDSGSWSADVKMSIHPSSSTGVIFALVLNSSVPLSVAVITQGEEEANLQVFLDGVSVATLDSLMLCYPERLTVHLKVTPAAVQISGNSSTVTYAEPAFLQEALERLNATMHNPVTTYIGGIPDTVSLTASPVTPSTTAAWRSALTAGSWTSTRP